MFANSADPAANTNQRLPPLTLPGNNYPYVEFEQKRDGSWTRDIVAPGYESSARGHMLGSFHEHDPNAAHKSLEVAAKYEYTTQGKTSTTDLNHDSKVGGSTVQYTSQDSYTEHGSDHMVATGGDTILASGGKTSIHGTSGTTISSSGDHVTNHNDGSHHINISNDQIQFIGGVKYDSIGGDYGIHVPNGNMDMNVLLNFNISANQQITLRVLGANVIINATAILIQDNSNNQIGMDTSTNMWIAPSNFANLYLGGNGTPAASYSPALTVEGPSPNVLVYVGG